MLNKPLWEMTKADFDEHEKYIKKKLKEFAEMPVEINTHVWNEIYLEINQVRKCLKQCIIMINHMRIQGADNARN